MKTWPSHLNNAKLRKGKEEVDEQYEELKMKKEHDELYIGWLSNIDVL